MGERSLHVAAACCLYEPSRRCLYVALEPTRGKCVSRASVGRAQNVSGGALKGSWFPTNERGRVGESPVVHRTRSQLNAFAALFLIVEFEPQFYLTFAGFLILL